MTRNDDPPIEEQIATEEARRDRMQAKRESRLSHDRGADAELRFAAEKLAEVGLRLVSRLRNQANLTCVEMTMVEDNATRVRAALSVPAPTEPEHEPWCYRRHTGDCVDGPSPQSRSVPAPTLPALDAETLTRALAQAEVNCWANPMGGHKITDKDEDAAHRKDAEAIIREYEALRDAV